MMKGIYALILGALLGCSMTYLYYEKVKNPKVIDFASKLGFLKGTADELNSLMQYFENHEDVASLCALIKVGEDSRKEAEEINFTLRGTGWNSIVREFTIASQEYSSQSSQYNSKYCR